MDNQQSLPQQHHGCDTQSTISPARTRFGRFWATLEDPLITVLLAWLVATGALFYWIQQAGIGLPHNDEYFAFMPVITGQEALSVKWLWTPANEHRIPLLKLYLYTIGEWSHWNFRASLRINLFVLSIGVLTVILALRKWRRGKSTLSDCAIPFAVLNPAAVDTVICYSFAYPAVLGVMLLAMSLIVSGIAYRYKWAWAIYAVTTPCIALAAGPPGAMWALGMVVAAPFFWASRDLGRTRHLAPVWGICVIVLVGYLIWAIPKTDHHDTFKANSMSEAGWLTLKYAVTWFGRQPLLMGGWPYLGFAMIPVVFWITLYSIVRFVQATRGRTLLKGDITQWMPVLSLLVVTLGLAAIMAYNRGTIHLWAPRYHYILVPIAVASYFLTVLLRTPRPVAQWLFLLLLGTWAFNWIEIPLNPQFWGEPRQEFVQKMRSGEIPLAMLAEREAAQTMVWDPGWGSTGMAIEWWKQLRDQKLSVFHRMQPYGASVAIRAVDGTMDTGLGIVGDEKAVNFRMIRRLPNTAPTSGHAIYEFQTPLEQKYQVWIRYKAEPDSQKRLTFSIDKGEGEQALLPPSSLFSVVPVMVPRALSGGQHSLDIWFEDEGVDVDFIEIVRVP